MCLSFGKKIKEYRSKNKLTIQELSEKTGISTALLSQLERGKGNPTLSVLSTLAETIGVSLSSLLAEEISNEELVVRRSQWRELYNKDSQHVMYSVLSDKVSNSAFDVMMISLKPRACSEEKFMQHVEEESLIVLEGELCVKFDEEEIELKEGDTIRILSNRKHVLVNRSDKDAVALNIKSNLKY